MFLSAILFAAMSLFSKALTGKGGAGMNAAEVVVFRFVFGSVVMLPLLRVPGARLMGVDKPGLIWRGVSGGFAVLAYFLAIQYTTLTNAVLLNFTSTIFGPLFSAIFLREKMNRNSGLLLVVAMFGMWMVTFKGYHRPGIGDAYGLASGILAGAALTAVRRLRQTETASSVFFYFSLVGAPVAALGMIGQPIHTPTATGWWLLVGMASTSVAAQMFMTYGYRFVRTAEGTLMTLSQIVYSAVFSLLIFHEPIAPTTIIGGALIMGSSAWAGMHRAPRA